MDEDRGPKYKPHWIDSGNGPGWTLYECPYPKCPFEGNTEGEVDDHLTYMASMDDRDHEPSLLN